MNRDQLDAFVEHFRLPAPAVETVLALAVARPRAADTWQFVARSLLLAGTLSLAAGVVFFVAANWDALSVFGRFALLQALLAGSIAAALWLPPPHSLGRYALLGAFVMTGALLALFGQTYQTGADVYELFLSWTLLALPLVIAGQWSILWGAAALVLNVALGLFCGLRPEGGFFWVLLGGLELRSSQLLLLPMMVNLLLWGLGVVFDIAPRWLRRLLLACALVFGTWAGGAAIIGDRGGLTLPRTVDFWTLLVLAATLTGVGAYAFRRRTDVFPLALAAGSVIALGTIAIATHSGSVDFGLFLMLALWLIVSSTVAGRALMTLVRAWRTEALE